ncbi:DUF5908 family protein [Niabella aquatica]
MPLEIRELHIKVTVNQPQGASSGQPSSDSRKDGEKESLISQCVEQVMELINNKKER